MHLYEIKAASFAVQLNELSSADIDRDLEKTAGDITKASSLAQGNEMGQDAADGMGAGDFSGAPDPAAGESPLQAQDGEEGDLAADDPLGSGMTDEQEDEILMKKVDDVLISAARGHPYTKKYDHQDNSKIHPYKILSMTIDELHSLRTMAKNKANIETFNGELGAMDNPEITFFQDLVSYVDKIIEVKKSATREYRDGKEGKTASFNTMEEPKTKAGAAKKPKAQ